MNNKKLSPKLCSKWVHSNAMWDIGGHQCGNKPVKDGLCKIHQPEYVAERIRKKNEAYDKRRMTVPYHSRNEMNRVKAKLAEAEAELDTYKAQVARLMSALARVQFVLRTYHSTRKGIVTLANEIKALLAECEQGGK